METDRAIDSRGQAWRATTLGGHAAGHQRHLVHQSWWLFVADVAAGFSAVEHGALLLSLLSHRRHLATDSRSPASAGATAGGQEADAHRRHYRQPVDQDGGKRGDRGYDAGKKIKGRKRHFLVDTLGLILTVVVHPADIQDRDGAKLVFQKLKRQGPFSRLKRIWADGGYAGELVGWANRFWSLDAGDCQEARRGIRGVAQAMDC